MNGYGPISSVYDKLNAEIDYAAWADGVEAVFDKYLEKRPELVLDLACGTGKMTFELAHRGYDMIGADISADMLMRARAKQEDESILWLMQDMREFELYGTVGAVVCCLDAVNCLLCPEDLIKCFSTVRNYLDDGGLFLFDVNSPYKFKNIFADNAYILEDEGIYCGWQNEFDKESGICNFYLSLFKENEDGEYRRYDETQTERCYTEEELTAALTAAGLDVIGFFGGHDMSEKCPETERFYVVAKKNKKN
ncbi:MAG: class I SAM-dependent methyltransferase [Clostridia bacterium]|nr:class I SAM-dependent methyltransferase [Clostridia bacterium]